MNEYEWTEVRRTPAHDYVEKHPLTPHAFLVEGGRGHFDRSDRLVEFLAMFFRKAFAARLPIDGASELRPVDPQNGWLVEQWHFDERAPATPPAPYAEYKGGRSDAFWAFDEEMANSIETCAALARGKKPQLIAVWSEDVPAIQRSGEPVTPRFLPDADGITFHLEASFADVIPCDGNNTNAARWTRLPAGSPLGHAAGGGPIVFSTIVGPVRQIGRGSFIYHPGRAESSPNRRNQDMWILAEHQGDDVYKGTVQQVRVRAEPNTVGAPQIISFPVLSDVKVGTETVKLRATSDSGLPVRYWVREGPVEVDGDTLRLTPIPPRAKFPIQVTVVAWQFGRNREPPVQTAKSVERSFLISR